MNWLPSQLPHRLYACLHTQVEHCTKLDVTVVQSYMSKKVLLQPRQASFFCIQTKGKFRALEQTLQKYFLFLNQWFGCAFYNMKTKNPPEKPFTFHQCFTETELLWDVLWVNLEFISGGLGRALSAHVVFGSKKTKSFTKSFPTLNLLLEFASHKQHSLWRSSHWQYKSAVSQAEDGGELEFKWEFSSQIGTKPKT